MTVTHAVLALLISFRGHCSLSDSPAFVFVFAWLPRLLEMSGGLATAAEVGFDEGRVVVDQRNQTSSANE